MSTDPKVTATKLFGWKRLVLWPVGLFARAWVRSLRFEIAPEDHEAIVWNEKPVAFILWHNRLFVASEFYRRYRGAKPLYALISASQDGAWLTAFFSLMGMSAVRGSSSRMGREAVTALIDVLQSGHDVGITPDGPRGPCYDFKAGALLVARRARAPCLLLGGKFESAWRVNSWDGFYIPKPFSKVRVYCRRVPDELLWDRGAAAEAVAATLREINPD